MGRKLLLFFLLLLSIQVVNGQRLDKGFKSLSEKDFFKAKRIFTKAMYGYPTVGAYGLSLMHFEDKNPFYSLDSALKYIVYADSALTMADKKEQKTISRYAVSKEVLYKHKLKIASKAYSKLEAGTGLSHFESFLKSYPFANEYIDALERRDSVAFVIVKSIDSLDAYRDYLMDYPGSKFRKEADSLYANRFFRSKIGDEGIGAYKQFVNDFPTSPYIEEAYDHIFANVLAIDTKEVYNEFVNDYATNPYTEMAWRNLVGLILKEEYSEKSLAKILADYPTNPLSSEVESELKGFFIAYFPVLKGDKWGFIRGDGEMVIAPEYEDAGRFHEGLAMVQKRGKKGFINKKGEVIITIEYDDVFEFDNGITIVEKYGKLGVIDRRNNVVLPPEYDDIGEINDNRILVEQEGKIGYFSSAGKQVIDFEYTNGLDFNSGRAVVKRDLKYGLIDSENKVLLDFEYDWIERSENDRVRVKQGNAFGIMGVNGDTLLPLEYDWIGPIESNDLVLLKKNGKIGYLNPSNEISVPLEYDAVGDGRGSVFKGNFALVSKKGKYGVINRNGVVVLPLEFDTLGVPSENFVAYRNRGRWGFRELNESKRIIEPKYDQVTPFDRGVSIVMLGGKYGVIDPNGMNVLNEEYKAIESEGTLGLLIVTKHGLKGLMDRDKNLILGFKYKELSILNYRYVRTVNEEGVSYYDLQKNKFIWSDK